MSFGPSDGDGTNYVVVVVNGVVVYEDGYEITSGNCAIDLVQGEEHISGTDSSHYTSSDGNSAEDEERVDALGFVAPKIGYLVSAVHSGSRGYWTHIPETYFGFSITGTWVVDSEIGINSNPSTCPGVAVATYTAPVEDSVLVVIGGDWNGETRHHREGTSQLEGVMWTALSPQ
jgi:hypothetical protein